MYGEEIDRRRFVAALPGLAAVFGATGCAGAAYLTPSVGTGVLRIGSAEVGTGALIAWPGRDRPIFVSRSPGGVWRAVSTRCTHRGCQTEPEGERLVCPCHGSEFSRDGRRLDGPAQDDLRRFPVRVVADALEIDVSGAAR